MRWNIPVAGSTGGAFGSNWKTGLQLFSLGDSTISGRLVFHPAGANGSANDPSMNFTLNAKQVQTIGDVVAAMGQSGLGSIDVIGRFSDPPPIAETRVYNDAGAAGTSGFTEVAMDMDGLEPRLLAINDVFIVLCISIV